MLLVEIGHEIKETGGTQFWIVITEKGYSHFGLLKIVGEKAGGRAGHGGCGRIDCSDMCMISYTIRS